MKCQFVRDVDVNPATMAESERVKVHFRVNKVGKKLKRIPYFPAGTIYEHPNADGFVLQGMADPADDECAESAGLTEAQRKDLQHKYARQAAGILQEDWELFDAGVIVGYLPDGNYKPGPNWDKYQEAKIEQEFPDDEEKI